MNFLKYFLQSQPRHFIRTPSYLMNHHCIVSWPREEYESKVSLSERKEWKVYPSQLNEKYTHGTAQALIFYNSSKCVCERSQHILISSNQVFTLLIEAQGLSRWRERSRALCCGVFCLSLFTLWQAALHQAWTEPPCRGPWGAERGARPAADVVGLLIPGVWW